MTYIVKENRIRSKKVPQVNLGYNLKITNAMNPKLFNKGKNKRALTV